MYDNFHSPYNNYYYDPYTSSSNSKEIRQYIIDFKTGEIYSYYYKYIELILMNEPELYDEYHNLSKRKRKKLKFVYVRKYNKKKPLFFPVEK